MVNRVFVAVAGFWLTSATLYAQSGDWRCPVIARLPADLKETEPPDYRVWFELRQCSGGAITVNAYERHEARPSLVFDTGYGYPGFLVHIFNVLVLESFGGSADHVFVFTFHNGKPTVALKRPSAGGTQVKRVGEFVVITVPPKTYPGPDGQFPRVPDATYSFAIEYR